MRFKRTIRCAALLLSACLCAGAQEVLFEDVHVVALPKGTYGYRGMPGSMVELKDGRLLLSYTRMLPDGNADNSIAAKYSPDKGRTWGDEFVLVPAPKPAGSGRYCHPSLLRLQNGNILLSYIYGSPAPFPHYFGHNYYRLSTDDGQTWGDQLIVTPHPGYTIIHNDKFVQLSNGRIVAPAELEVAFGGGDHAGYVSITFYSDDGGYSWGESKNTVKMLPVEAQEPHVVELKDGRVMMLMRTYSGSVARAYSSDKAETWSEGEMVKELPLPPSSSALNVKRIPSTGDLLLLRASGGPQEAPQRRTPFVSVVSTDDGVTWTNERVIAGDPEDDYGYPSLLFVEDNGKPIALISYHRRDGLHVARIGIDWFYGKLGDKNMTEQPYPFSDPPDTACFTCSHVLDEGADILFVSHDADDGMWQFLCGADRHTTEQAKVIGLGQILTIDSSIAQIGGMPVGIYGERADPSSSWRFTRRKAST